jgi:HD-GYP domain-containing protein (c-di-GMP phosphodiesterase class II)
MSAVETLRLQLERFELLLSVSRALASERDRDRLLERILLEAKRISCADGGTLYLRTEDDQLRFAIVRNDTLGMAFGGSAPAPDGLRSVPLFLRDGRPNDHNVASYAVHARRSVRIDDAYDARGFDFSGAKRMDAETGYRSKSFLTVPLIDSQGFVIGVLQLINAIDPETGEVASFLEDDQSILEALAAQAGVALENRILLDGQKALLESVIQMIAAAIDSKSPYTGGHCERVPELALGLVEAACEEKTGPFASFELDEEGWYELRIAAWLHDCGKVVTPVHVMDKATKLETIYDRIELIHARMSLRAKELEAEALRRAARGECTLEEAEAEVHRLRLAVLEDFRFLKQANVGAEFLDEQARAKIRAIAEPTVTLLEGLSPLITEDEVENLSISRGTLTEDERLVINGHMVDTIRMLESLPFPRSLRRVPEYAGGHHERMDGTGYPKGLYAGDMSIPARAMAIADVFEALTAQDRPYKKGKSLSETMRIMGFMKADNHLDPDLFDLFVRSGVYREYAERMLPPELIDDVDEEKLLAISPKPFTLPPKEERDTRWHDFLEAYRPFARRRRR